MGLRIILLAIGFTLFSSNMSLAQQLSSKATFFTIRLKPHQDLKKELMAFAAKEKIKAGCIVTCVGSLEQTNLRFANQPEGKTSKGHFEILSLTGTFSDTSTHLHLSVADSTGAAIGGHLLDGNLIYTTAEVVIGELTDLEFIRLKDSTYGYQELGVKKREVRGKR
jgi:uncharacterized protein